MKLAWLILQRFKAYIQMHTESKMNAEALYEVQMSADTTAINMNFADSISDVGKDLSA